MAELKTQLTKASATTFINAIKDEQVRKDCRAIASIMKTATRARPRMWGSSIVGFGTRKCQYADGRVEDWMVTAFAPRKTNITLYIGGGFKEYKRLRARLGKHSGNSCIYIKRLSDVDVPTLKKLVAASVKHVRRTEPKA